MNGKPAASFDADKGKPENKPFADAVRAAMTKLGLSQSDLAGKVSGYEQDARGRSVARNRDSVGHYLRGTRVPERDTVAKLESALDLPAGELDKLLPKARAAPSRNNNLPLDERLILLLPQDERLLLLNYRQLRKEDRPGVLALIYQLLAANPPNS